MKGLAPPINPKALEGLTRRQRRHVKRLHAAIDYLGDDVAIVNGCFIDLRSEAQQVIRVTGSLYSWFTNNQMLTDGTKSVYVGGPGDDDIRKEFG